MSTHWGMKVTYLHGVQIYVWKYFNEMGIRDVLGYKFLVKKKNPWLPRGPRQAFNKITVDLREAYTVTGFPACLFILSKTSRENSV